MSLPQPQISLFRVLARNWWMLFVNGTGALVFGGAAFAGTEITLETLVILVGSYFLLDGFSAVGSSFARNEPATWWPMLFAGMVGIIAGVAAVLWPALTALRLLFIIGAWAMVRGSLDIVAALAVRETTLPLRLLVAAGLISILLGGYLLLRPGAGALAAIWTIASLAVVRGVLVASFSLGLRVRASREGRVRVE